MTEERIEPLGPDSLTWRFFGDWRGLLQGLWAGSMQNMHPGLGAGVEYLAVAVNFNVLEPARNDLALPVDLATISYGVIKVHKKPWFGR